MSNETGALKHLTALATGSEHKRRECSRILGYELEKRDVRPSELQPSDAQHELILRGEYARVSTEIAEAKAVSAYALNRNAPILIEDSSLFLACRHGFPGPLVRFECSPQGLQRICRDAHQPVDGAAPCDGAVSIVAFAACAGIPPHAHSWLGEVHGRIAPAPRGTNGFGWDSIFIPNGSQKTYAEMTPSEKDAVSARGRALAALRAAPDPWVAPTESPDATAVTAAQLIGTWDLLTCSGTSHDGRRFSPYGAAPVGRLVYTEQGAVSVVLMNSTRAHLASDDLAQATDAEICAAFNSFDAYSGRWKFTPAQLNVHTAFVEHTLEAARIPNWVARVHRRSVALVQETLTLTTEEFELAGSRCQVTLTWRRSRLG